MITQKQRNCIQWIESMTGATYEGGDNGRLAFEFIGAHIEQARAKQAMRNMCINEERRQRQSIRDRDFHTAFGKNLFYEEMHEERLDNYAFDEQMMKENFGPVSMWRWDGL